MDFQYAPGVRYTGVPALNLGEADLLQRRISECLGMLHRGFEPRRRGIRARHKAMPLVAEPLTLACQQMAWAASVGPAGPELAHEVLPLWQDDDPEWQVDDQPVSALIVALALQMVSAPDHAPVMLVPGIHDPQQARWLADLLEAWWLVAGEGRKPPRLVLLVDDEEAVQALDGVIFELRRWVGGLAYAPEAASSGEGGMGGSSLQASAAAVVASRRGLSWWGTGGPAQDQGSVQSA